MRRNPRAYNDLMERGFEASITGQKFSSIHGDLITELFNKQTKGTSAPFRSGFSTDFEAVNRWISTIHIHCKLREALRKELVIKTSSTHKESNYGSRKTHKTM